MRGLLLVALLAGCQGDGVTLDVQQESMVVRAWLDGAPERGAGVLVVQTEYDPAGKVDLPQPVVEGLRFDAADDPVLEVVGQHEVLTQRFAFSGKKGSYEIGTMSAIWHGPDGDVAGASSPLFVDLSVDSKRPGEAKDIVEPRPVFQVPWAVVAAGAGGLALFGGGLWVAFASTGSREPTELPPESPDVVALRAWEAVRRDVALDPHDKALGLSRIFREYIEQVLSVPATAWTTTEIMLLLRHLAHLPEGNVPRAKRLLRATDLVKFADKQAGADFFEDLDSDLRAFVASTRPQKWGEDDA
jgi:hypothetical protein